MELSPGIEIVWTLAAEEMKAAQMKAIEPDHFLCAVLKFSELATSDLSELGIPAAVLSGLQSEVEQVKKILKDRAIQSQTARHEIRKAAEKGHTPFQGDVVHRSDASRRVFEEAARQNASSGSVVRASDLLQALLNHPTPAMTKALKLKAAGASQKAAPAPALEGLYPAVLRNLAPGAEFLVKPASKPQVDVLAWSLQTRPAVCLVYAPGVKVVALLSAAANKDGVSATLIAMNPQKLLQTLPGPELIPDALAAFAAQAPQGSGQNVLFIDAGSGLEPAQVEQLLQGVLTGVEQNPLRLVIAVPEEIYSRSAVGQAMTGQLRVIWLVALQEYQTPHQV